MFFYSCDIEPGCFISLNMRDFIIYCECGTKELAPCSRLGFEAKNLASTMTIKERYDSLAKPPHFGFSFDQSWTKNSFPPFFEVFDSIVHIRHIRRKTLYILGVPTIVLAFDQQ